jgi:hypothetical protein
MAFSGLIKARERPLTRGEKTRKTVERDRQTKKTERLKKTDEKNREAEKKTEGTGAFS